MGETAFMKKTAACLLLLAITNAPVFCQDSRPSPHTLTSGWQKMQKNLPPEMQEEFENTLFTVLSDPKITALKKEADEAQLKARAASNAYRQAVRALLAEKNPALGKKVQEEILKLQELKQNAQKETLPFK
jgi:hypothetical protein